MNNDLFTRYQNVIILSRICVSAVMREFRIFDFKFFPAGGIFLRPVLFFLLEFVFLFGVSEC